MKRKLIVYTSIIILFLSCVSKEKYDKILIENQELKNEVKELKFGAKTLFNKAKEFIKNNELDKAQEILKNLIDKHGETSQAKEGRKMLSNIQEEQTENSNWDIAVNLNTIDSYQVYLNSNPSNPKHILNAKVNISKLTIRKENEDLENVLATNSSEVVRDFINKYPNHKDIPKFKKKLINLEVNEIFGDSRTGQLPSFDRTSYGNSKVSLISITNDTNCELTVRYSGSDIKRIDIPAGKSRTITLSSGSYRIAASACGANYAGTEGLQGNYSSKYYIVSSRF